MRLSVLATKLRLVSLVLATGLLAVGLAQAAGPDIPEMRRPTACPDTGGEVPCTIRFKDYRPPDPRVALLERKGARALASGGRVLTVESAAQLNQLKGQLKPGDEVLLRGSEWTDARLDIQAEGSFERPIVVRADSPQGLRLSGASSIWIRGGNIVLVGLRFVDGIVSGKGGSIIALGSLKNPCDHCILWSCEVANVNPEPAQRTEVRSVYLSIYGRDITVADSVFRGKRNLGKMLTHSPEAGDAQQRLHLYRNRFADIAPGPNGGNGYEVMQLGSSDSNEYSSGTVIEANSFEDCDGAGQIVDIKYADLLVLNNRFLRSQGTLSLRQGARVYVGGNRFDGGGKPSVGGVRIMGAGHVVADNVFTGLRQPVSGHFSAIALVHGSQAELRNRENGYAQVRNVIIAGNRFLDDEYGIFVGASTGEQPRLPPRNVAIVGNTALQKGAGPFFRFDPPGNAKELVKGLLLRKNTFCVGNPGLPGEEWRGANTLASPGACPVAMGQ